MRRQVLADPDRASADRLWLARPRRLSSSKVLFVFRCRHARCWPRQGSGARARPRSGLALTTLRGTRSGTVCGGDGGRCEGARYSGPRSVGSEPLQPPQAMPNSARVLVVEGLPLRGFSARARACSAGQRPAAFKCSPCNTALFSHGWDSTARIVGFLACVGVGGRAVDRGATGRRAVPVAWASPAADGCSK